MTLPALCSPRHRCSGNCSRSCCPPWSWSPRGTAGRTIRRWIRPCPSICQRCTTRSPTRRRSRSSPSISRSCSWRNQSFPPWPSTSPPRIRRNRRRQFLTTSQQDTVDTHISPCRRHCTFRRRRWVGLDSSCSICIPHFRKSSNRGCWTTAHTGIPHLSRVDIFQTCSMN